MSIGTVPITGFHLLHTKHSGLTAFYLHLEVMIVILKCIQCLTNCYSSITETAWRTATSMLRTVLRNKPVLCLFKSRTHFRSRFAHEVEQVHGWQLPLQSGSSVKTHEDLTHDKRTPLTENAAKHMKVKRLQSILTVWESIKLTLTYMNTNKCVEKFLENLRLWENFEKIYCKDSLSVLSENVDFVFRADIISTKCKMWFDFGFAEKDIFWEKKKKNTPKGSMLLHILQKY